MGAKYSDKYPSMYLPEDHPFYWAEEMVQGLGTVEHHDEHVAMGGDLDRDERVLHLIHHIKYRKKNDMLTPSQELNWGEAKSSEWIKRYNIELE